MDISLLLSLQGRRSELRRHQMWDHRRLERYRADSLRQLREHAYARSPFYRRFHRDYLKAPLEELPVLTKADLMRNWDDLVVDRSVKLAEVTAFLDAHKEASTVDKFRGRYYAVSTAGSTGLRGVFIYDRSEWAGVLASYNRAYEWAGVRLGLFKRPPTAILTTSGLRHQSALVGATMRDCLLPTICLDSTAPMRETVARLNQFQPRTLIGYASMVCAVAQQQLDGDLKIFPEAVFCSSEILTRGARRFIEQAWGKPPFNVYGATETAVVGSECSEHGVVHVGEDTLIVESVDEHNRPMPHGEFGAKILVTVLFSRTLPLVRYEMTDSVMLKSAPGNRHGPFCTTVEVRGRRQDVVCLKDSQGRRAEIWPNVFRDVMETLRLGAWQIVQTGENSLRVSVKDPAPGFNGAELGESLRSQLRKYGAEQVEVTVETVAEIARGSLGKTYLIKALER